MPRGFRGSRIDANQRALVDYFRTRGVSVGILSNVGYGCPDLILGLVNHRGERVNLLVEIKDGKKIPSQQQLTVAEDKFHSEWLGQVCIIKSKEEAKELIDRVRYDTQQVPQRACDCP